MGKFFHRVGNSLHPSDEAAEKAVKRLEQGESVELEMKRIRSARWHKMFIAGCASIAENSSPQLTTDAVKETLKLYAGHVVIVKDKHGNELMVPKRIAFNQLSADQWSDLFPHLEKAAIEHFDFSFSEFTGRVW